MKFYGEQYYLNNYYPCEVKISFPFGNSNKVFTFPSAENAYQAHKVMYSTVNENEKLKTIQEFTNISPKEAKEKASKLYLNSSWDKDKKHIMSVVIDHKFNQNSDLKKQLLNEDTYDWSRNDILCSLLTDEKNKLSLKNIRNDNKPFYSSFIRDNKCYIKMRKIIERDNTVYNYTEILSEDENSPKEIFITRWEKDNENTCRQFHYSTSDNLIFLSDISFEEIDKTFRNIEDRDFLSEIGYSERYL